MKKAMKTMAAVALCAVAMVAMLSSCSTTKKVPSQQEIEAKIVGKWKTISIDGKECLTNDRGVFSYSSDGVCTISVSTVTDLQAQHTWSKFESSRYSFSNFVMTQLYSNGITTKSNIYEINDNYFVEHLYMCIQNTEEKELNKLFVNAKVTADYSQDIIGMWEGVAITGDETYGDAEARIEYKADGTYTYYKKENGNNWMPSKNVDNEYNVDGDWLATRWRPSAGAEFNYEWWDIDYIKGDEMKWSALREKEDGTRFTTTFTWKRVK